MRLPHILLALLVTAVWGFNFVVIKVGIDNFPPILFSALRFAAAALPLAFFVPRPVIAWRYVIAIGVVLGIVKFTLLFLAMDVGLSAGLSSLVLQSQAFFTIMLAAFVLGERPKRMQLLGIFVAFCGLALIALTVDASITITGLALGIAAAFMWAISNLLMKQAGKVDMFRLMVHVSLIPPIPLFALSLMIEGWEADMAALSSINWTGVGAVIYIAYAATIFGFAVWGMLIRTYGAGRVAPFSLLVPIFGMSSSALFLGETFGPLRMVAAALVLVGLMLTQVRQRAPLAQAGAA